MGRTFFFCVCMILAIMRGTVYCRPTCSVLEFPEVIENIVQTRVNESVTIRFSLNTESCSSVPDEFNIKVTQKVNNRVTQVCRIRLKGGKCTRSDTSSTCYCPSTHGEMLFLKRVTKADDGLYTWTWSEQLSSYNEKKITLRVIEEERRRHPLSPGSHREPWRDKKTEGPDPKHQESDSILPDMTRAVHQRDADGGLDIKLIVIGAILVGVVVVVVIARALIYLIRGQRRLREAHQAGGVSSPQAPLLLQTPENRQATFMTKSQTIKSSRANSGDNPEGCHQPRAMRSYVKILHPDTKMADQKTMGRLSSSLSSVEYLHPVSLCFDKQRELIVRYTALTLDNLENPEKPENPDCPDKPYNLKF